MNKRMVKSCLFYASTEDAITRKDDEFRFTVPNTSRAAQTVGHFPTLVQLSNVFPNLSTYMTEFQETDISWQTGVQDNSVVSGQYLVEDFVLQYKLASIYMQFSINVDGYVSVYPTSAQSMMRTKSKDIWDALGYSDQVYFEDGYWVLGPDIGPIFDPTVALYLPNVGGEKTVFIVCDDLAPSNMISTADGHPHDVISQISFAGTDYGEPAAYVSTGVNMEKVEFKERRQVDTFRLRIEDANHRLLPLPDNHHLRMVLRIFHED